MHLKIVHDLFYNVQNLNSNEDIITSALATMFDKSDKFMLGFFNKVFSTKLSREKYNKIKKSYEKNGYYCDTGYELSNNAYTWLECKPKINFKPDIWLDFYKDGLEKDTPPKTDGGTILVESKIDKGTLTPKQKEGFKQVATINQIQPLLRLMIDTKTHDKKAALYSMFDEIITWNDVVNFADEVIKEGDVSGADDVVLSELRHRHPIVEGDGGRIDAVSHTLASHHLHPEQTAGRLVAHHLVPDGCRPGVAVRAGAGLDHHLGRVETG